MTGDWGVIQLDPTGRTNWVFYPLALVAKNILGMTEVRTSWLVLLVLALLLVTSVDHVFKLPSTGSPHRFSPRAFLQDGALFFVQVLLTRVFAFYLAAIVWVEHLSAQAPQMAQALRHALGLGTPHTIDSALLMPVYVLLVLLADDLGRYACHRLEHRVDWLWALHKFHHSAPSLNVFTGFREHPVLHVLGNLLAGVPAIATTVGMMVAFPQIASSPDFVVGGLALFLIVKVVFLVGHYHRPISFGWLDLVFVSPAIHAIHHSSDPAHHDKNFGGRIMLWDQLFGTYHRATPDELARLEYGLPDTQAAVSGSLVPMKFLYGDLTLQSMRLLMRRLQPRRARSRLQSQ
jgi:sterol desaturase/sphingolipid hydroxylase (fatty acid hydroxylase superfamily)